MCSNVSRRSGRTKTKTNLDTAEPVGQSPLFPSKPVLRCRCRLWAELHAMML